MVAAIQVLEDGISNVVILFTSDGADAEDGVLKVDVSALDPPCARLRIMKAKWGVSAGTTGVSVLWDADTDDLAWQFPSETSGDVEFVDIGGLQNPQSDGWTGDVLFTSEADTIYTIVLWMKKKPD